MAEEDEAEEIEVNVDVFDGKSACRYTSWKPWKILEFEYSGISSKVLENLEYEPIFGAVFLPC